MASRGNSDARMEPGVNPFTAACPVPNSIVACEWISFSPCRRFGTMPNPMPLTPDQLAALRKDYSERGLRRSELNPDPILQFQAWLHEADEQQLLEPNA